MASQTKVAKRIEEKWLEQQKLERDPRVKWDLAWSEIKRILQQEKKN